MSKSGANYWKATRHPAPCLLFVIPLLIAYEVGIVAIGGQESLAVRNGADVWMRWILASAGLGYGLLAPAVVVIALIVWAIRNNSDPPADLPGVTLGIAIESVCFALGLWAASRAFGPLLDSLGLDIGPRAKATGQFATLAQVVTFIGAGIYEEVIFRLGLFCGVAALLRMALVARPLSLVLAAGISALGFAAVHHVGTHGEAVNSYVFAFRAFAGLFFTLLFLVRGFGITVGTHACYDVLVGINL